MMNLERKKDLKNMKQLVKDIKIEKFQNKKIVQNDHIDEEHFDKNFHGVRDMFVKLFGP